METIKMLVTGANAVVVQAPVITVGMIGCLVEFAFDESWDNLVKNAMFRAGNVIRMEPAIDAAAIVPAEVLEKEGCILEVGVFGISQGGDTVIPTVWVSVDHIKEGVGDQAQVAAAPELPVWQKVLAKLNALIDSNLNIVPKNLVVVSDTAPEYGPAIWYDTGEETAGRLVYVDEYNQQIDLLPKTLLQRVEGSAAVTEHMNSKENPHGVTLKQLCEQGPLIFGPKQYGDTFPEDPVPGQVFAKRVSGSG